MRALPGRRCTRTWRHAPRDQLHGVDPDLTAPHAVPLSPRRVRPRLGGCGHCQAGGVHEPGAARLEINYTVLTLTSPRRTRFRYRLEGYDRDWVDAGIARQAVYTNLAPRASRSTTRC